MSGTVLSLAVAPLRPDEGMAHSGVRVYFAVSDSAREAPGSFDLGSPRWQARQSGNDLRTTNRLFNQFQELRVGGAPLLRFMEYQGVSMWQFLPSYIWPSVFRAVELINVVTTLLEEVAPGTVRFFPVPDVTARIWQGVVRAAAAKRGIPLQAVAGGPAEQWRAARRAFRSAVRRLGAGRWLGRMRNLALGRLTRPALRTGLAAEAGSGRKLLFATHARHWTGVPGEPGRFYDEQVFPLLPGLRQRGWDRFIGVDCPYSSYGAVRQSLLARMAGSEPCVRWQSFYAYGTDLERSAARAEFARRYRTLRVDQEFQHAFRYQGVRLWPALEAELREAFVHTVPDCVEMLRVAGRILETERPDGIAATYESGPYQRALIIEAHRRSIPSVGLMHGMIFDNHYDYMHADVTAQPLQHPAGFAVPTRTCVWGPFWEEILTRAGHYPPEAVAVTGHWRYDRLARMVSQAVPAASRARFGMPEGSRLILILSGGQSVANYVEQCLHVVRATPGCTARVKLHPADDPAPIRSLIAGAGLPPETLIEGQLVEAMIAADLVISQVSTAISEAVLVDRMVILADFLKRQGWGAYVEEGICLYADDRESLAKAIKLALEDPEARQKLSEARPAFIAKYFYKVDGQAGARVADVLTALAGGKP